MQLRCKANQTAFVVFVLSAAIVVTACVGRADDYEHYSPAANQKYPTTVYFGDTHLHTNLSVDANGMGNRAITPDSAYFFAKGESVRAHNGELVRLRRPLDFLVIADHAENLGVLPRLQQDDPLILQTEVGKRWLEELKQNPLNTQEALTFDSSEAFRKSLGQISMGGPNPAFFWRAWREDYVGNEVFRRSIWDEVCANADRHNEPGKFTAFIGYEWTPSSKDPRSANLHRNIIFEGNAQQAGQVLPFSSRDSNNVEDLWVYLKDYEDRVGGEALAIPHYGNLSRGLMFRPVDFDGNAIDVEYATTCARWEPLYEVTQYKGDAEAHPILSPTDENGNVPPVGSTVDIENASFLNSIGDPELATVWRDPDFDASELAFYYVRVIEIPTPRWTAQECLA